MTVTRQVDTAVDKALPVARRWKRPLQREEELREAWGDYNANDMTTDVCYRCCVMRRQMQPVPKQANL